MVFGQKVVSWIAVAPALALACTGCGPGIAESPGDDEDLAGQSEGVEAPDATDAPAAQTPEVVRLLAPEAYGLDLEGSPVLEPRVHTVGAVAVRDLLPTVHAIEVTEDLDLTGDEDDPYATVLTIRGLGPGCEEGGDVLAHHDSRDPAASVFPDPALAEALAADLRDGRRGTCSDEPKHSEFAPFGPGFWNIDPCRDARLDEIGSGAWIEINIAAVLATNTPAWAAACVQHLEPAGITACENLVGTISGHLIAAESRIAAARVIKGLMFDLTLDAVDLANNMGLGFPGPAAAADIAELASLALEIVALHAAGNAQATAAVGHVIAARTAAGQDWVLIEVGAPQVLGGLVVVANGWQVDYAVLTRCFRRVTSWIAALAAIGFGIRFFQPPPGLGIADAQDAFDPDESILYIGPRRAQSLVHFFSDSLKVDVSMLTSAEAAMTRYVSNGYVSRNIFAGYEKPGFGHTLPSDIIGPDPITLLPIVLAPAGAKVLLGEGSYGGPSNDVYDSVYDPSVNTVFLGQIGIDVNWTETDAAGVPTSPLWALCKVLPEDPMDPRYCQFGMNTTVPPWEIGDPLSKYWRVWVSGGIIDPENGEVIEPEGTQFFMELHAPGEGPENECWVWSSSQQAYLYSPGVPGCGPGGDGGYDDGGDGGSDDGGDGGSGGSDDGGLPPPP